MLWAGSGRGLLVLPGHSWGSLDLLMTGEAGAMPGAWQACGFSRVTVGSRREAVSTAGRGARPENRRIGGVGWELESPSGPTPEKNTTAGGWGAQEKPQWCHDRTQAAPGELHGCTAVSWHRPQLRPSFGTFFFAVQSQAGPCQQGGVAQSI